MGAPVLLRSLQPNPAAAFSDEPAGAIIPDLLIVRTEVGWDIEINEETLPRLMVDRAYAASVRETQLTGDEASYVREHLQKASWLVRAVRQRTATLLRIGRSLIARQAGFFDNGVGSLKPLTLREVANELSLHESTVSRAVAGKYLQGPQGTVPLRFFFPSGVSADDGESHAAAAVQSRIRELIRNEGAKPLSDDKLVKKLKAEGFDIARRTVAKYREGAGIPSSVERRRQKALAG